MSFNCSDICHPWLAGQEAGGAPPVAAAGTLLAVGLVQAGQYRAEGASAHAGALVVGKAPMVLEPLVPGQVLELVLGGTAPAAFAATLDGPYVLSGEECPGAAEMLVHLAESCGRLNAGTASALGYALLCCIAEAESGKPQVPNLVTAALGEIREHYGEVYGIEELATQLEVSKSHLIRRFTVAMGVSPGRYLTIVRIENAKRLLSATDLSLEAIASLCGFSGANYLIKVFKKETGEPPTAWRSRVAPATGQLPATEMEEQLYL